MIVTLLTILLGFTLVHAQPSGGGGNGPQTQLQYPIVQPLWGPVDRVSGVASILGYNITVDIVAANTMGPPPILTNCFMASGIIPNSVFNKNFLLNQTVSYPSGTTSGYRYLARLNAIYQNASNPSSLPPFIRGDCSGLGGTVGAINTRPFPIFGISPSVTTVGSWKPVNNPSYASGNPWGPISITGLNSNVCTSSTEVVVMVGPLKCNLLTGSTSNSPAIASPHCDTLISNPTAPSTSTSPARWDVYCTTPILAGTNLPVTIHLIDTVRNATVASSSPDTSSLFISAIAPVISSVDLYMDAVTSMYTRTTMPYGTNTTIIRDVPASPTPNTEGRIIVSLGTSPGICPRVELRANTTIIRVWQFASSSSVSSYCGLNVTLLGANNMATLTNFPSSGLSSGTLDLVNGLGFRLVVGDGIRIPSSTLAYFSDSEVAGGGAWLVRYAAPSITSVSVPVFFRAGTLGAPFYRVNVTGTNFGPVGGPFAARPTATIGGFPCSSVVRVSDTLFTLTTPVGSGNGLALVLRIGDNDGLSSFSYPAPIIEDLEVVSSSAWKAAATLAAFTPRTINIASPRRHPRGATLNVSSDSVVIVRGRNFGPWKGNGTKTNDLNPVNVFWEFESYGMNINGQCIATPWAGRGNAVAAPNCNGVLDYVTEGELPNSGTVLYWNDTFIAFAAPPSGASMRELVINFASGVSTYSSNTWYDVTALLQYGAPVLNEYGLLEPTNTSFTATPANLSFPMEIPTVGGTVMYITGAFFQVEDTVPPSYITVPSPLPANRSELFNNAIPDLGMVVFAIGKSSSPAQCILRYSATASAFGANSAYTNPAVPFACRTGIGAGTTYAYSANNTAIIPLPAGNGVNISVTPILFDAIPDPVNKRMTVVQIVASALPKSLGTGGSGASTGSPGVNPPSVIDNPVFSYLKPTITVVTPKAIGVNVNLATVTTRFTLYGTDLGVEDTNGCTVGAGAPAITTAVEFVPYNPNAQTPIGGYSLIPEMGMTLAKVKGVGSTACSSVVNTYGYFPNLPVGWYGIRLTVTSTAGSRTMEIPSDFGVAFTCGAGYYGQDGQRCLGCGAFTGASCPGGNVSFDAYDLGSPVIASAGYYNYFGDEATACPPNTPTNNKPTGRNVCIAPCTVSGACLGNNQCATGYTSQAPNYGCGRCDTGYARVNGTQCGAIAALSTYGNQCVLASTCTNAGGDSRVISGIGEHGEDVCWCNSGEAPSPSPSPSYLPPSASSTASPSMTSSPSTSGTPAAASSTSTPTPSGTRTSSPTPTPSSSVAPSSCTDNLRNGDESDVDCGGKSGCSKCVNGLVCRASSDCIGAGGGSLSDAICSDATRRCTDVRTGGGYWDSISSAGGSSNGISSTPLSFIVTLNATVAPAGLTADGLEALRVIFESVSKQQIVKGGIANDAIYTVAALSSVVRTGMVMSSSGRRMLQTTNVSGIVVLITANIIVAPTASAPSGWDASVKEVVSRGAFSPASMAGPLATALGSSSSTAWSNSASNGQLSMQSSPSDAQALVAIVSVENAIRPTDGNATGTIGVAVFLIALVGLSLGIVMHSLRTKGHFLGYRMTPIATVFGLVPLSPAVKHSLRINTAGKYGRKLNNRNIMGMANDGEDMNISTNPISNGLPSTGVTYMMPNNVPVTTYSVPVRTSFAPSGTDYGMSTGNPMNGMTVTTPLALYTSPRVAARQGSMMFTNTGI